MLDVVGLNAWIPILEAALPAEQNGMLVRFSADSGGVEMGVLPLDGAHPSDLLEGFEAPDDWCGLGIVTRGWAHPSRGPVIATLLVDRGGNAAGRIVDEDSGVVLDGPASEGEVPRLLRAALGVS